jgi:hypothetical protein
MLINTGADINDPERLTLKNDDFSMLPAGKDGRNLERMAGGNF